MNNQFLVSVANAVIRDPNTLEAIMYGTANIDSALTISMAATEVRGGINNPLLYTYMHDRKVDVKITQATFDKNLLALNSGNSVLYGAVTAVKTDCLTLAGGAGTLTQTPTSDVTVFLPNGTVQTVVPTGTSITVSGGANQMVTAVYNYSVSADQLTIETTTPPDVVDLTLIAEVRDNTNVIVQYLQINIPRFQVSGNYTLSLAANGVSNQALEGTALAVASTTCSSGEYYAKVTWLSATSVAPAVSDIAATPTTLSFSVAAGLPASKQITTYGLRGGLYSNVNVTTSCSYVASGCACFTVGANTGLVTAASGTTLAGYTGTVTVTYYDATSGSLTDTVRLVATA